MYKLLRPKAVLTSLLLLVSMIGIVSFARAQEGSITACVNAQNGSTRIVTSSAQCRESEYTLQWNISGPSGPPGPQGVQGPQGEPGPQGLPGHLALAGQMCPPGQFVTGFDVDGSLVCGAIVLVEVCDGQDNDADGLPDNGLAYCFDGTPAPHTDGAVCDYAYQDLDNYSTNGCESPFEVCDGQDNDFDESSDEELLYCFDGVPAPHTDGAACLEGYAEIDNSPENGCERDTDGDAAYDDADNCPATFNMFQGDADQDGLGDVCDPGSGGYSGVWVLDQPVVVSCSSSSPLVSIPGATDPALHAVLQLAQAFLSEEYGLHLNSDFSGEQLVFDRVVIEEIDSGLWVTHLGDLPVPLPGSFTSPTLFDASVGVSDYPTQPIPIPPYARLLFDGNPETVIATIDAQFTVNGDFSTADTLLLAYEWIFDVVSLDPALSSYGSNLLNSLDVGGDLGEVLCQDFTLTATAIR